MNNKLILGIVVFTVILLSITSCQSKEEKIISRLNNLSERVDKYARNFDAEDWDDVLEELEEIHEDMEDCEFTREEQKEVGRAYGRLTAVMAKEGTKAFGRDVSSFLKNFSSFAKGFQENFNEEDFSDVVTDVGGQLKDALQDIAEEWKK